jgi:hypothetical protein
LGFFLRRVGYDDAALTLVLFLQPLDDDAVVQGLHSLRHTVSSSLKDVSGGADGSARPAGLGCPKIKVDRLRIKGAGQKILRSKYGGAPTRGTSWALLGITALLGCAAKPSAQPLPPAPATAAAPGVRVLILWSAPVDLDLYVTDPSLETIYFGNPVSGTGGRLERDVTCGTLEGGATGQSLVEAVEWDSPRPGRYRVGIDFIDACGSHIEEAEFRVVTEVRGNRRTQTGRVRRARFQPLVIEFDVS